MADELEKVVVPTEEAPEEPETPTEDPEEPETPEHDDDEPEEDLEQVRKDAKAFQDQKRRAEKAEAEARRLREKYEPKERGRAPKKGDQDERYEQAEARAARAEERAARAELRSMGITHPDDIELVTKAGKELGIDPVEAAERRYVKAELEEQREIRRTKDATPAPGKRSGQTSAKDVGTLADKVEKGGALPSDPVLAEKVQDELARRANSRS